MEDEIKALKEQEQQTNGLNGMATPTPAVVPPRPTNNKQKKNRPRHHHRPSLFGPFLLIGAGVYFLLRNMGLGLDLQLNWWALWQAWPLFLILIGLKIISEQAESSLLRGLTNLARLAGFGLLAGLLFFGHQLPWISNYLPQAQTAPVNVPLGERESAVVEIEFNSAPVNLYALDDSLDLLAGTVSYFGRLDLASERNISLQTTGQGIPNGRLDEWQLGLTPQIPLDMSLDMSSGAANLDLQQLTLQRFGIDGGSGATTLYLPNGDYRGEYKIGSGSVAIHLPTAGQQTLTLDGGSGGLTLHLSPEMAAQILVDDGSGRFNPAQSLQLVSGSATGDGVWETAGYDANNPNRLIIRLDIGSGSVNVRPLTGR